MHDVRFLTESKKCRDNGTLILIMRFAFRERNREREREEDGEEMMKKMDRQTS